MTPDRALARIAGAAQRTYQPAADLYRESHSNEALSIEIRRDVVAVIEALDLLRFHIRQATLNTVIEPPIKRPVAKAKAKAKR